MTALLAHAQLLMGEVSFSPSFTTRIALPLTYDEADYNGLLTWTRSGGGGPHITPQGMIGNAYDSRYKATGLSSWLSTSSSDLLLHASVTLHTSPTGNGSGNAGDGDVIVHVGEDDSLPVSKMGFWTKRDIAVPGIPRAALHYGGSGIVTLARYGWKYEHQFPALSVGGFSARPQALLLLDANTYLITAHYEDTLSRCYKLDINSGAVLGYFDFPSPYLHVSAAAMREDGTVWFSDYATKFTMRVDVDASLVSGTAVITLLYDTSIVTGTGSIEWARLGTSNDEYLILCEYQTSGSPYLYLIPPSVITNGGTFAVTDRYKRFVCEQRIQGIAIKGALAYTTMNRQTSDGSGNLGKIQSIDLTGQADSLSDGGTLVGGAVTYTPSGLPQDLDFHPVTGWCWTSTEGYQSVGDFGGFMSVWSGPNDGSAVENHYTAFYDHSASTIEVRINNRTFQTQTGYSASVSPATVTVGGWPSAAAGLASGYGTASIRNIVISDPAAFWSDDAYLTAVNGLYEPNALTVYPITITNPGAESGTTGWTNEVGTLATRSSNPAPYEGTAYFSGGSNAATKARQRFNIASATGLSTAQIDAGGLWARATWFQASFGGTDDDTAAAGLRTLDGTPTPITESVAIKAELFPEKVWMQRGHALTIASGSRNLDFLMDMTRASGTNLDGYFDALSLVLYRQ